MEWMQMYPVIPKARRKTIYILGTSTDINGLPASFFDENVTIGINQSYKVAERKGKILTYWICLDEFFAFFDWVVSYGSRNTVKFVPVGYFGDPRLLPAQELIGPDKIVEYVPVAGGKILHSGFDVEGIKPTLHTFKNGYTIHTAVSLAAALGADDIRLRGVSLGGDYADRPIQMSRDLYYDDIKNIFLKDVKSMCSTWNIKIKNETADSSLDFGS